jgi:hypothetical protein
MSNWKSERTAPNVVTVRCKASKPDWEQWALLRSDVHHDNPHCDQKLERRHLEQAKKRDAIIIDNGDLFCAMQGKFDKRGSKDSIRPEHANGKYLDSLVSTAADFYAPYAEQFAVLGLGNHETAISKHHETDLTDRLAGELKLKGSPVLVSGYGGWVRFRFDLPSGRSETFPLHHYHGSGGGGPVTRGVITTNRMAVYTPDARIILTGHTHDEWNVTIARQRLSAGGKPYRDEVVHVRAAGYKDAWADGSVGFEVERQHGPKPIGAAWVRFFYDNYDRRVKFEITNAK